jgi:hypothetical protein
VIRPGASAKRRRERSGQPGKCGRVRHIRRPARPLAMRASGSGV